MVKENQERLAKSAYQKRYFSSISTLFDLTRHNHSDDVVSDKTWFDLDMDSMFCEVDSTLSDVGQQYLYRKIRFLESYASHLEQEFNVANKLKNDSKAREKLQLYLRTLDSGSAGIVAKLIFSQLPDLKLPN